MALGKTKQAEDNILQGLQQTQTIEYRILGDKFIYLAAASQLLKGILMYMPCECLDCCG